jgi:hypothetical protein
MIKELKKIKTNEFYVINIFLLYAILLCLMLITLVGAIFLFLRNNIILTILGSGLTLFYGLYKLKKMERYFYE